MKVIDPPSGWMYGFPKAFTFMSSGNPDTHEEEFKAWLIEEGYPQRLVDQGLHKFCRYWEHNDDN